MNEHVRILLAYLNQVLANRDRGESSFSWSRFRMAKRTWFPFALSVAVTSCAGNTEEANPGEYDGADCTTLCADGRDNDKNRAVDCADPDCAANCRVAIHASPVGLEGA